MTDLKGYLAEGEPELLRGRRPDLKYVEKKAKDKIERVTVELKGNESGALTRLASRYDRLDKAIKKMGEKRNELNAQIKGDVEDLFAVEDVVLTRVIETVSFTLTVSKLEKQEDKIKVNFEAIASELTKLISVDLQDQVDAIIKAYTEIIPQSDKSPALRVKPKIEEGLADWGRKIVSLVARVSKAIKAWAPKFDKKMASLKKMLEVNDEGARKALTGRRSYRMESVASSTSLKSFLTEATGNVWVLFVDPHGNGRLIAAGVMDSLKVFSTEAKIVSYMLKFMREVDDQPETFEPKEIKKIKTLEKVFDLIRNSEELGHYDEIFEARKIAVDK